MRFGRHSRIIQASSHAELQFIPVRLKAAGKGIILFHDTKAETSAMLPAFLRYLRDNGYHLVHAIPVEPAAASNH